MHRKPPLNRISVMVMVMDTKKNAHIATNEETKNEKTTESNLRLQRQEDLTGSILPKMPNPEERPCLARRSAVRLLSSLDMQNIRCQSLLARIERVRLIGPQKDLKSSPLRRSRRAQSKGLYRTEAHGGEPKLPCGWLKHLPKMK